VIAVLGLLTAGTEAGALIVIAPLVQAAAEGADEYVGGIGPIVVTLSLGELSAIAASMLVAALAVQLGASFVSARLIASYQLRARLSLLDAFQQASWSVQAREREGWLLTLANENINRSAHGVRDIAAWIKGVIGMTVFLVGALVVNILAVLVIVAILGGLALGLRPLNRLAKRLSAEQARYNVRSSEELAVLTSTSRELSVFGVAGPAGQRFRQLAHEQRAVRQRTDVVSAISGPLFRTAGLLLIVGLIAYTAQRRDIEIATVGLVAVLLYRSFSYGETLVGVHQRLVQLVPVLDQLEDGVTKLRGDVRRVGDRELASFSRLQLSEITFRYPGAEHDALRELSLEVTSGEVVGVVGPSGAGKSTLAELVLGLRQPDRGEIRVDGIDLWDLTESSRAGSISLLSQSVPLVPGTVRDNVRFFRDIDDADIDAAIRDAGLDDVVSRLAEGSNTMIGPGHRMLSGGQAQRVGLARALAGSPTLIVLDEPTSALDAGAEQLVTDLIGKLRGRVSVIVIAHRLTTLRHCTKVIVLEHGIKADEGTLDQVRRRNPFLRHAFEVGVLETA
jgi:ATP-binding cassette, subfamily B, bacterial